MIKAVFFDVDNTLYSWKTRRFVPSGIEAVKALQKKGVKVFLCSARPYHSLKQFGLFDLGIHWNGWVANSGGVAYSRGKFVQKILLDNSLVHDFLRFTKEQGCMVQVITPLLRYYNEEPNAYFAEYAKVFTEPFAPVAPFHSKQVVDFLLFAPKEKEDAFRSAFPTLNFFRFHDYAMDVTPVMYSKGEGIRKVLEAYDIDRSEALGFGDDEPDIGMKEGLDHFCAMGNALEKVKKEAEHVTDMIDEDGLYHGLRHYGLLD
ncbi:MAG: Cof-type HAD-IIB family hydrolase [Candidatus Enteromonas sp.]|nr:Cof-type HAD-IIB family hydrolase [Candidatus Enteromonas sp.]